MNTSRLECGILRVIHCNEQNSKIIERMRAGNGKQLIIIVVAILFILCYVAALSSAQREIYNMVTLTFTKICTLYVR